MSLIKEDYFVEEKETQARHLRGVLLQDQLLVGVRLEETCLAEKAGDLVLPCFSDLVICRRRSFVMAPISSNVRTTKIAL